MSQQDFEIYSAAEIIAAYPDFDETRQRTRRYNEKLHSFLLSNGLYLTPSRWEGFANWDTFSFRKSDLTDEGFELVRQCHDKWLSKIDRSGKIDMDMWAKALDKLRGR